VAHPQTQWTLSGADDQPIFGDTHLPDDSGDTAKGVMLICHGFKGYKDYGLFPQLAEAVAAAGLIAHRFNFSHSGMTNNTDTFEQPELFERDTWSRQIHDLQTVAQAAATGEITGQGLPQVWFGHSRGGVTVLLTAARARQATDTPNPAAIITAAAPAEACSLPDDVKEELRDKGRLPSPSARTKQTLYVGKGWLDEIEANPEAFDPYLAAASLQCPHLILHGSEDQTVPPTAAHAYHDLPGQRTQLHLLEDASHTFNAPNPLPLHADPPRATRRVFELACAFAQEHVA